MPIINRIGLWGSTVQTAYRSMGIIGFAHVDIDAVMKKDELAAQAKDDPQGGVPASASRQGGV